MSEYPGDARFAAERDARRATEAASALASMTDAELGCALLVLLWREYHAANMSYGRSAEARLLEAAQGVLRLPYPADKLGWPSRDQLIAEAKRRAGERPRLVKRPCAAG